MKKHFYLVSGSVMFAAEDNVGSVTLNAVVSNSTPTMAVRQIGRAQQSLQMNFWQKVDPSEAAKTKVLDVVILSVSYLGEMTEEEFHAAPEGMTLQERPGGTDPTVN